MWKLIKPKARHLIALAIFLPLLLVTLYVVTKHTDAYEEAERFVSDDTRIVDLIGRVREVDFKFWEDFQFTGSDANFTFEVVSERGTFSIDIHLRNKCGNWRVETADIRSKSGFRNRIEPKRRSSSLASC